MFFVSLVIWLRMIFFDIYPICSLNYLDLFLVSIINFGPFSAIASNLCYILFIFVPCYVCCTFWNDTEFLNFFFSFFISLCIYLGNFLMAYFQPHLFFSSIMGWLLMSHQRHSSFSGMVVFVLFRFLNFWYFLLIHSTLDMFCSAHRNFSCLSMRLEIWMKWYN